MDNFTGTGVFWLADNPETQVAGTITFSAEAGATIDLIGAFGQIENFADEDGDDTRILGVAGRKLLTLSRCLRTNRTIEMPGIPRETWNAGLVLAGAQWGAAEQFEFDRLTVEFDQLPNWVSRSGVEIEMEEQPERRGMTRISATLRPLDKETVPIDEVRQLSLNYAWFLGGDHITDTRIGQSHALEISYATPQPLDSLLADLRSLQDLVTLGADAPAAPVAISVSHPDIKREGHERLPEIQQRLSIDLYMRTGRKSAEEPQNRHKLLLGFDALGGLTTAASWLTVADRYRSALGSLFSIRYSDRMYIENQFLNVVTAAETFHRIGFSNEVLPADQYKTRRRSIIRAVPKEHRDWLGNRLQFANEPRLSDRLRDLIELAGDGFQWLVPDGNQFVDVVVHLRNRLTHYDEDADRVTESEPLWLYIEALYVLVVLAALRTAEVAVDALAPLRENQRLIWLRRQLGDALPQSFARAVAFRRGDEAPSDDA
ncbi:MAG: hypothetical protein QOG34_1478 [Frankiaceae bacterium]|nr:hypothetical protein [Frankiaceae bacterium]